MHRFTPNSKFHKFIRANTIKQKDYLGYHHLYICPYCKIVCKCYEGATKFVLNKGDKRVGDCVTWRRKQVEKDAEQQGDNS